MKANTNVLEIFIHRFIPICGMRVNLDINSYQKNDDHIESTKNQTLFESTKKENIVDFK